MSWVSFAIITLCCAITILACRVIPVFALKGRELPDNAVRLLNLIPPATFAALIANDLIKPDAFVNGIGPAAIPFIAAILVFAVGYKTKSLVWCIVVGVGSYALLMLI
jgi:branched-subunit amino acid transport protein